jgi:hypothetical protein
MVQSVIKLSGGDEKACFSSENKHHNNAPGAIMVQSN